MTDDSSAGNKADDQVLKPNNRAKTVLSQSQDPSGLGQTSPRPIPGISDRRGLAVDKSAISQADQPPVGLAAGQEEKEASGSMFKEIKPEAVEQKEFEMPKEVKDWVQEEKKDSHELAEPIADEYGQIIMESAQPAKPILNLPLTQDQTKLALKYKVVESVRWLAEWCLRMVKMFPKRTAYKSMTKS
jgi:hypothetical protein